MEKEVLMILRSKGIQINEDEAKEVAAQWRILEDLKKDYKEANLAENNMGIVHRLGGITNE